MDIRDIYEDAEMRSIRLAAESQDNFFKLQKAQAWLSEANQSVSPRMLFGEFWHEGELCILFADTNLGKSILAVQIAESIAGGKPVPGLKLEAGAQTVLYFDFELTAKQFEARYSVEYTEHYPFSTNMYRAEINPNAELPHEFASFEDHLTYSMERCIQQSGAKVLIIDNLTYLREETERAKDALPLMKQLKALKSRLDLSILALAHTPKRDLTKPVTRNDLQGSKMLINFCDSAFALGESHNDKGVRYLKQIKQRNTEQVYDSENVCLFQIEKLHNFLQFSFIGHSTERQHLKAWSDEQRTNLLQQVKDMSSEGKSQRQIATELGVSVGVVNKYLNKS
jgi:RecA-family ATPase